MARSTSLALSDAPTLRAMSRNRSWRSASVSFDRRFGGAFFGMGDKSLNGNAVTSRVLSVLVQVRVFQFAFLLSPSFQLLLCPFRLLGECFASWFGPKETKPSSTGKANIDCLALVNNIGLLPYALVKFISFCW
jgi:hypothetical protein